MAATDGIHDQPQSAILRAENRLLDSYTDDVGHELELADRSAALLLAAIGAVGGSVGKVEIDDEGNIAGGDVQMLQLYALQIMGARALRVMRAARATLAFGWEIEARAQDRILIELHAHRKVILDDKSGSEANAWLNAERIFRIGARVAAVGGKDLYPKLSQDSHGDPRPITRMLGGEDLDIGPKRTIATRACLLMHAGFARDHAAIMAVLANFEIKGLDQLDSALKAAIAALEVPE
jgi:hypothetical protein